MSPKDYLCPRCDYCTRDKSTIYKHFHRKNVCKNINQVELTEEILEIVLRDHVYHAPVNNDPSSSLLTSPLPLASQQLPTSPMRPSLSSPLVTIKVKRADKPPKSHISQKLREMVWNKYIGESVGKALCLCCGTTEIRMLNFSCGHVIPRSQGGPDTIDNLRPICFLCNSSMNTLNLFDFKASLQPSRSSTFNLPVSKKHIYTCPRCNHVTKQKGHMRAHFERTNVCPDVNYLILTEEIKENVLKHHVHRKPRPKEVQDEVQDEVQVQDEDQDEVQDEDPEMLNMIDIFVQMSKSKRLDFYDKIGKLVNY